MKINSKEYWDKRFCINDWALSGGELQNKYFYNLLLELIPTNIKDEILHKNMSICDFGCAEGDGLVLFKDNFSASEITGIDISEYALENARKKYININWVNSLDKNYQVIISSNTLEHFKNPSEILINLFSYAEEYVILLLPFQEYDRIEEHFSTFDFDNILFKNGEFKLIYLNLVNSDSYFWNGKQVILVYKKNTTDDEIISNYINALSFQSKNIENLDKKIVDTISELNIKQSKLMKLSDWASEIDNTLKLRTKELEEKDNQLLELSGLANELEKKDKELVSLSDWASKLNTRLNYIDNNRILRNLEKLFNKELSIKRIILKSVKFVAKKVLPTFVINRLKQRKNLKQMNMVSVLNDNAVLIDKDILSLVDYEVLYVFPVIDWLFRIQRPQQIAKSFLNSGYKVVYFKTTFCDSSEPGYAYEILDNSVINISLFLNEKKNLYKDKLTDENINFLFKGIALLEKDFLINKRISIIDHPFWFPLSKKLSGNFTIYDCMDYHPGFGDESKHLIELEEMSMTQSDLLVLTSSDLFERFSNKNKNSILVRNGCEFEFFNTKPNEVYQSKYEKVIGYYGAISSWFDTQMVIDLATHFTKYEFLMVGSTYGCQNLEKLEKLTNVTLVGEVEYSELTKYLYSFDVAIMPFIVNELTIATNPVKVYEYLSSAVYVVATKLPEIDLMGDVVYSANNLEEFISGINKGLETPIVETINKRLDFAKMNDWQSRYLEIKTKIESIDSKKKKVSIILVTYNNLDFTKACLHSMEKYNNYSNCEIIVVDNLSQDGTREYLTEYEDNHKNFKAILHDVNSGFAAGNNIGINEATGDIIILLNNDTYVTPNWIQNFIIHFDTNEKIGMIGPRTNNIGNEARLEIQYSNIEEMIDKSYNIYYDNISKQYEIPVLAFFCVAIKKEIISELGLLDDIFGIGMFEDDDYCMRVKKAGYKIICTDDVFIHHHLGASFNKDPEWKEKLFQKNKAIYENRWGKWEGHSYR